MRRGHDNTPPTPSPTSNCSWGGWWVDPAHGVGQNNDEEGGNEKEGERERRGGVRTEVVPPGHRVKGARRALLGSGLIERRTRCAPPRSTRTRILGVVTKDQVRVTIHNQGSLGCYLVVNRRYNQGVDKLRLDCRYMVSSYSLYTVSKCPSWEPWRKSHLRNGNY